MKTILAWGLISALLPSIAFAQDGGACQAAQEAVTGVNAKYKQQFDEIQKDGEDLKSNAHFGGKVGWKDEKISFDLPSVTVKDQKIVFGVPQVTMKLNEIIFDTPSVRMVPTKTGQYPEITCHGFGCTVTWHDIITNIPQTFWERQVIKMDIPEFKWDDTEIVMGIPEFSMVRNDIVMGLPQVTVTEGELNAGKLEAEGKALKARSDDVVAAQNLEIGGAMHGVFDCQRNRTEAMQASALAQFDSGIARLRAAINDLSAKGINVSKVVTGDGRTINLNQTLAELMAKRQAAQAQFEDALRKLDESEKKVVSKAVAV